MTLSKVDPFYDEQDEQEYRNDAIAVGIISAAVSAAVTLLICCLANSSSSDR